MNKELPNIKIRTYGNENYSKAIQDLLFKMGYSWPGGANVYLYTSWSFLIAYDDGNITSGESPCSFNSHRLHREVDFKELNEMVKQSKVPEYTMQEAIEKMGHEFKIKK